MSIKSINSSQAENLIKKKEDLLILDVRRPYEFKESRIVNSINIPVEEIEWEVEELEKFKEKPILVYCKIGVRSSIACNFLENEGFKELYNLRGGILDFSGEIEE